MRFYGWVPATCVQGCTGSRKKSKVGKQIKRNQATNAKVVMKGLPPLARRLFIKPPFLLFTLTHVYCLPPACILTPYTSVSASTSRRGHRGSNRPRKSNRCRKSCASTRRGHTSETQASPQNAIRRPVNGSRSSWPAIPPQNGCMCVIGGERLCMDLCKSRRWMSFRDENCTAA